MSSAHAFSPPLTSDLARTPDPVLLDGVSPGDGEEGAGKETGASAGWVWTGQRPAPLSPPAPPRPAPNQRFTHWLRLCPAGPSCHRPLQVWPGLRDRAGEGWGSPSPHRALAAAEEQRFSLPSWLHGWVPRLNWPKRVRGNSLQEQGLAQKGRRGAWPRMERVLLGPLGGSRVRFPGGQAQEGAARWQPRSLRPTVSPGGQWPGTRTAWAVVGRRAPWPGISKPRASAPPSVDFG